MVHLLHFMTTCSFQSLCARPPVRRSWCTFVGRTKAAQKKAHQTLIYDLICFVHKGIENWIELSDENQLLEHPNLTPYHWYQIMVWSKQANACRAKQTVHLAKREDLPSPPYEGWQAAKLGLGIVRNLGSTLLCAWLQCVVRHSSTLLKEGKGHRGGSTYMQHLGEWKLHWQIGR